MKKLDQRLKFQLEKEQIILFFLIKKYSDKKAIVPMVLAVGAVHSNLVKLGLRGYSSINVQTAEAMDTHSFCSS